MRHKVPFPKDSWGLQLVCCPVQSHAISLQPDLQWGYIFQSPFLDARPMSLTEIQAKQAKPKAKPYKLAAGHGLYLEHFSNGEEHEVTRKNAADQ